MSSTASNDVAYGTGGSGNFGFVSALDSTPHLYRCTNSTSTSGGTTTWPATCGVKNAAGGNNSSYVPWFLLW
jgi:hypothetical protein